MTTEKVAAWAAHRDSLHSKTQARKHSFDAGWEAALRYAAEAWFPHETFGVARFSDEVRAQLLGLAEDSAPPQVFGDAWHRK